MDRHAARARARRIRCIRVGLSFESLEHRSMLAAVDDAPAADVEWSIPVITEPPAAMETACMVVDDANGSAGDGTAWVVHCEGMPLPMIATWELADPVAWNPDGSVPADVPLDGPDVSVFAEFPLNGPGPDSWIDDAESVIFMCSGSMSGGLDDAGHVGNAEDLAPTPDEERSAPRFFERQVTGPTAAPQLSVDLATRCWLGVPGVDAPGPTPGRRWPSGSRRG